MSAMSSYTREYFSRPRVAGRTSRSVATSADGTRAPGPEDASTGTLPSGPDVRPTPEEVRAMDDAEWEARVEQRERLFTCRWDGD